MYKILVIDDNLYFLGFLVEFLEFNGFQVISTQNGQLGLQLAQSQLPDLIICDIRMPEIDGYEVLNKIRQNLVTKMIPLIFLTSEATDNVCRYAKALGADNCLDKSCIFEELIKEIKSQMVEIKQAI